MVTPAKEPLTALRNARFVEEWNFAGDDGLPFDFTGYTAGEMHVRLYGAQAGLPQIDLDNVTSDVEGVWIREPSDGIVRVRIDQTTLATAYAALLGDNELGSAVSLVYDLRLTGPDGAEEVWLEGAFIIEPGVTI